MLSAKPWRNQRVIQFFFALFICFCFSIMTAGVLRHFGVKGFQEPGDAGSVLFGTLTLHGLAWLLIWFFLRDHQVSWSEAFGFRGPQLQRALGWAVLTAIIILPIALLLQSGSDLFLRKIGTPPTTQPAVQILEEAVSPWM